jgi:hypothetical protein
MSQTTARGYGIDASAASFNGAGDVPASPAPLPGYAGEEASKKTFVAKIGSFVLERQHRGGGGCSHKI